MTHQKTNKVVKTTILLIIFLIVSSISVQADVKLPHIIGDNMVLQRGIELPIWGWADAGEQVTVEIASDKNQTKADSEGKWMVKLSSMNAGGPYEMKISGKNTINLKNIMVGDVWVCSGQSNMELSVNGVHNSEKEIAEADYPNIRLFQVPNKTAGRPRPDVDAQWQDCKPETVRHFSAVAYFFAREINKELSVPVGLINTSWGGARIEPWTAPEGFAMIEKTQDIVKRIKQDNIDYRKTVEKSLDSLEKWLTKTKEAISTGKKLPVVPEFPKHRLDGYSEPTSMYNAMVAPLVPFAIRGALWYQGESNLGEGMLYYEKMKALIGGWRKVWGQDDFPFYYVQLAPFRYGGDPLMLQGIWEAQVKALSIPNTGMAVTVDIVDNVRDIHPRNKQDVGKRLALWALAKTYGKKAIVYSGPLYKSMKVEGETIRIYFDHAGSGLASRDGRELTHFEIAGSDKKFVKAKAIIDGDTALVSSDEVKKPAAVRYGWREDAEPNLSNKEGLPASPFRTDDW